MDPAQTPQRRFLTDVILELGFAGEQDIKAAVEAARLTNKTVDQILVDRGDLTEDQLAHALATHYGTEYVELGSYEVDMAAAKLVTRSVAQRCQAVPIAFAGDQLVVAIANAAGAAAAGDIGALARMEVKPVIASRKAIEELIAKLPERDLARPSRANPPAGAPVEAPQGPGELMEEVMRLADPSQEVSPDLKLVENSAEEAAAAQAARDIRELRTELDRLLVLEHDLHSGLERVSDKIRQIDTVVGGGQRAAELEEKLEATQAARDEAERERDELQRRLAAIRDRLGQGNS